MDDAPSERARSFEDPGWMVWTSRAFRAAAALCVVLAIITGLTQIRIVASVITLLLAAMVCLLAAIVVVLAAPPHRQKSGGTNV